MKRLLAPLAALLALLTIPTVAQIQQVVNTPRVIDDVTPVTWTSGTSTAAVSAVDGAAGTLNVNTLGSGCTTLWMLPGGTDITAGVVAFDALPRTGGTWVELSGSNGDQTFTQSDLSPHTTAYNGKYAGWRFPSHSFKKIRIRLQTAITGSDSISVWGTSVAGDCAPFSVARQGDPARLNMSARNYTSSDLGGATWTSATAADTRATITVSSLSSVFVTIRPTGTITGGVITTELSDSSSPGSSDWFQAPGGFHLSLAGLATSSQQSFTVAVPAATTLAVRLTQQITGSSSPGVTIVMIASSGAPVRTTQVNFKSGFILTTATLSSGGTYTGPWFDNSNDGGQAVVCYARSNVASAASGFVIQQTTDPSDSNFFVTAYSVTANAATTTAAFANTYQRYWRVTYTNGGTNQTSFKITCSVNPVQFMLTDTIGTLYTNPTLYTTPVAFANSWTCALDNIAASLTQCIAVPASGSYYITSVIAVSTTSTAGTFAIRSGTGSNCGTSTTGVMPGASTSRTYVLPANTAAPFNQSSVAGVQVTAGHAVCVIGAATNTTNIVISGYRQ